MKTKKFILFIRGVFRAWWNIYDEAFNRSLFSQKNSVVDIRLDSKYKFMSFFFEPHSLNLCLSFLIVSNKIIKCVIGDQWRLLRMGLITSPNYCKYFLLFKLIAEHTTVLTFIQLVESNWCNVSGRKNVLVAKLIGSRRPCNRAGGRGLDKSNSLNIKGVATWWCLYVLSNT